MDFPQVCSLVDVNADPRCLSSPEYRVSELVSLILSTVFQSVFH